MNSISGNSNLMEIGEGGGDWGGGKEGRRERGKEGRRERGEEGKRGGGKMKEIAYSSVYHLLR